MDQIKDLLRAELDHTIDRIRNLGGGVVFHEFPDVGGEHATPSDEGMSTFRRPRGLALAFDMLASSSSISLSNLPARS